MKKVLQLEEAAQFLLGVFLFSKLEFPWWYFPAFLLLPDLSMLGYLGGNRIGAGVYNFFHHKALAVAIGAVGMYMSMPLLMLAGIILYAHSAMDRGLGYGLKYSTGFQDTHLGKIGKHESQG
ncbi:uncharacterized protein DUF4260 [Dyadobacter jejuensis]|uniref:Uncharacterized protein DUF4260 n=1 Tax=Dyadobacter jejuensis TaxID=1082580 RepID=A0A316ASN5_9BACT|nr:DUF4260 domain-containing protein [Dyadobacter jejuensis]PWJ60274.1 uncharacterized protein DUF4260 [Dyadobacter jejuensis]